MTWKKFNQAIAYVFHPLSIPSLTFAALTLSHPSSIQPLTLAALPFAFALTYLTPLLILLALHPSITLAQLKLVKRKERHLPLLTTALLYTLLAYPLFIRLPLSPIPALMMLAISALIVVLAVINWRWMKISIHAAAVSGMFGFFVALYLHTKAVQFFYALLLSLFLSMIVTHTRWQLKAHTPRELLVGASVGFFICFILLYGML